MWWGSVETESNKPLAQSITHTVTHTHFHHCSDLRKDGTNKITSRWKNGFLARDWSCVIVSLIKAVADWLKSDEVLTDCWCLLRQTGYWSSRGQRSNSRDLHLWQVAVLKRVSLQLEFMSVWSNAACWPDNRDKMKLSTEEERLAACLHSLSHSMWVIWAGFTSNKTERVAGDQPSPALLFWKRTKVTVKTAVWPVELQN